MRHITTPKGIDYIIQSKPLSDKERREISEFIKKSKEKNKRKNIALKKTTANNGNPSTSI